VKRKIDLGVRTRKESIGDPSPFLQISRVSEHRNQIPSFASKDVILNDIIGNKMVQFANNPSVEVCWYFREAVQQFRISGTVHVYKSSRNDQVKQLEGLKPFEGFSWEEERLRLFRKISPELRLVSI
jgi:hypothetical protein